jgi:cobalamin biosynthesis Mg chelatase CobN
MTTPHEQHTNSSQSLPLSVEEKNPSNSEEVNDTKQHPTKDVKEKKRKRSQSRSSSSGMKIFLKFLEVLLIGYFFGFVCKSRKENILDPQVPVHQG